MRIQWTQEGAIRLCREVEKVVPKYGYHVALTGGCLYKDGPRKDLDLMLYRIREDFTLTNDLLVALSKMGFQYPQGLPDGERWCIKALSPGGMPVDLLFPDCPDKTYEPPVGA